MTTPPTSEPSAEALAARTHAVADVIVHEARRGGYGHSAKWEDAVKFAESIIDAEFAALRAELKAEKANHKTTSGWFDDAVQQIKDLRARLERAEEDSKRLDWLGKMADDCEGRIITRCFMPDGKPLRDKIDALIKLNSL